MTAQSSNSNSGVSTEVPVADIFLPFPSDSRLNPAPGLSGHVRRQQKKNQGISRWLVFAVLGGVIVAFAMVQFAIR